MSEPSGGSFDFRLYATVVALLLGAFGLATLLVHRDGSNAAQPPNRFLGLDEPAQPVPPRR